MDRKQPSSIIYMGKATVLLQMSPECRVPSYSTWFCIEDAGDSINKWILCKENEFISKMTPDRAW